jgi:hypothetical protein
MGVVADHLSSGEDGSDDIQRRHDPDRRAARVCRDDVAGAGLGDERRAVMRRGAPGSTTTACTAASGDEVVVVMTRP